ncbi:MAG TPA: ArsR family transcriptional regulator [Candidatus Paceibacterota bacterium]
MDKIKKAERILKALANRRRLLIIKFLHRAGRSVPGSIAEEIKLSFKATSKHLGILFAAEIVEREQIGLRVDYFLKAPIHRLIESALESF